MEVVIDSKVKLIESAIDAFSKYGFTGCSTAQIAEDAGVSEALLFKHFKSKKKLLDAVLIEIVTNRIPKILYENTDQLLSISDGIEPLECLKGFIKSKFKIVKSNIRYFKILINEIQYHDDIRDIYTQQVVPQFIGEMSGWIEQLQHSPNVRKIPPRTAFRSLVGMMNMILLDQSLISPQLDLEAEIDIVFDLFLYGMIKE